MKHILVTEDLHQALRMKAVHNKKTLQEVANELLTDSLYSNKTTTQGK